jgi:aspartate/methionine/tyrosine aminotransferase
MIIPAADRLGQVETYYFAKKLAEIDSMNKDGGRPVINLGIGSPDLTPPPAAIEKISQAVHKEGAHKYQSYRGIPALREAYSKWYQRHFDIKLDASSEILPLIGSKEGIMHLSMAFINPGDQVLVPNPGYPAYTAITKICGGEVIQYDLDPKKKWHPDFEQIEKMDLSRVKIMWINYPHMPTGAKASLELFEKIIAFGKRNKILIGHDNPYTFILNEEPLSILKIDGAKEVALELTSLSKNYNMAGWRVGAVAGKAEYLNEVLKFKSNMDSGMFRPLQEAAIVALTQGQDWHDSLNNIYTKRRQYAWKIMDMLACEYDRKAVGLFVWGRIPHNFKHATEVSDAYLYDSRVFITPGHIFGSGGDQYVRISLCADIPLLESAIKRIEKRIKPVKV